MCGITGVLSKTDRSPHAAQVSAMVDRLAHRGPDARGVEDFGALILGHARLKVIDLSEAAAQPMIDDDAHVAIVYNGEVYNFVDLRTQLESVGHTFRSNSDTEVVLRGYLEWGEDVVNRLNGHFAFAIWDGDAQRLVLARDRTGQKPLYLYEDDDRFAFASEIKALLALEGADTSVDLKGSVGDYLAYGYVPTPRTFYAHIQQLEPGSLLVIQPDARAQRRYWTWPTAPPEDVDEADAAAQVRDVVRAAVHRRLVSDVPVGALLSGGIDSSIIVGLMAERGDVRTFSIGFDGDDAYDETDFARIAAHHFGTDHTELRIGDAELREVDAVLDLFDQPFGDSSALPTRIVSRLAREHVTVALGGDGGDEVFAGYDRFRAALLRDQIPDAVGKVLGALATPIPSGGSERSLVARGKRFMQAAGTNLWDAYEQWVRPFSRDQVTALLGDADDSPHYRDAFAECEETNDVVNQLLYANARNYLLDDLLVKADRASMAYGLELRAPFLDPHVIEYASRLPGQLKIRGQTTKAILRDAFADLLPPELRGRPKMGFGVPLAAWFRGPLRTLLDETLRPERAKLYEVLNREAVTTLLDEHETHKADHGQRLYHLLLLERWLHHS